MCITVLSTVLFAFDEGSDSKMPISLKTITLYNFKSYNGEVIIGPFQPFTAIVGPNGSGKSNIMDAISFILGEKLSFLRVNHLGELLHGASIGKPVNSAYLTAIFMIDDTKEKHFTRTIHRKGSQYKIDDEIVTNDFYMTALRELGLDIKLRNFLISQGYIEHIAMKKPKELTIMFEQFSGSNIYKTDYERLKMELLEIEDKIQFMHNIKKQQLTQKKYIIAETAEAEKYLNLQRKYMKKKLKFQLIQMILIKKIIEAIQNEKASIKSQIDEHLRDKRTAMLSLEHKKSEFASLSNSFEDIEQTILQLEDIIQKKKMEHAVFQQNISHWQKKLNCIRESLDSANKMRDTTKQVIQELENELEQIGNKLVEFREASQQSDINLSNSQVERYMELKNNADYRARDFVKQINCLKYCQQKNHDKFDNENRRKQELEDKAKQTALLKKDLEKHLQKLQNLNIESKAMLMEQIAKRQELNDKIIETENKSLDLKNNIAKISEHLCEATMDNYTISRQKERFETMKMLKEFFSGVHDRLSNLCKPIHPRYNVAVTKVFGKNIDAIVIDSMHVAMQCIQFLKQQQRGIEIFLPLDSLKVNVLKERLRDIKEPVNVKLLFDILNVSSAQINKAVLFVTKNTLVCETAEDARFMAYEFDKHTKHDCVSVDGCFYRKDGTISGGRADLVIKAKQWEMQQISGLKEQMAQLKQEFRNLPQIFEIRNELERIDVQIRTLSMKNKYIEQDLKNTENEIAKIREESDKFVMELSQLNETILEIERNMQVKDEKIKDIENKINAIADEVFVDFCKDINVQDVRYYEKNNLWTYQEQERKRMEFKQQYDRIQNQLYLERERDTKNDTLRWKRAVEETSVEMKLNEAHQQEHSAKSAIEQEERKLSELLNNRKIAKEKLEEVEKRMALYRSLIGTISVSYLQIQKTYRALQRKIEKQIVECRNILKECKMEDITIPMLSARSPHILDPSPSTNSSSLNAESLSDWDLSLGIDFSQFPENIRNSTKEDLQNKASKLNEKLTEIQNELTIIENPNLKAGEKMDSVVQEIKETNTRFQELRKQFGKVKAKFEKVQAGRYKLFSDCLERVATEIDPIYKTLVNDTSVQAFIIADNPEEPYTGGINYSCIAPSKRFQPMQHLSGGEKSLASLALLFAIQRYKPTPFFIMDEGDAALDNTNIKNIARFICSQMDVMQFLTITLQKSLYLSADALIGVTTNPDAEHCESMIFTISLKGYRTASKNLSAE